jgi:hypothetical protein
MNNKVKITNAVFYGRSLQVPIDDKMFRIHGTLDIEIEDHVFKHVLVLMYRKNKSIFIRFHSTQLKDDDEMLEDLVEQHFKVVNEYIKSVFCSHDTPACTHK